MSLRDAVESAIEGISPGWALRREESRARLEASREFRAGSSFRGARQGRMENGWPRQQGITGQTYADRYELRSMRDRSRDVDRNNPIGQGMLNRIVDNVVGEGFTLQAKSGEDDFNREVEEKWGEFIDDADVRGIVPGHEMLRLTYRGHERDGDAGLVLVSKGGQPKLQSIEADQVFQPDGQALTPTFVDGVEMDRTGKPIRYHVLDSPQGGVRKFTAIPAANFIFFPRFKRYGNNIVRGEPCFGSNFTLFDQAEGYVDGVATAARLATIFGLIFKEATGPQQLAGLSQIRTGRDEIEKALTIDQGGMVRWVGGKDSVVQVQAQQPMQQTPEFIAALLRLIGLPLDMPLELVLLDFSRVNYSSARAAFLQFYQAIIPKQKLFRIRVMSRIFRWWLDLNLRFERFTTPVPEGPNYWRHHFMPRGWQWVNPVQEAQAALLEISMGVNSPQRVAARLGRDYDQILAEISADTQARRLCGLPVNVSSMTRDVLGAAMAASKQNLDPAQPDGAGGAGDDQADDGSDDGDQEDNQDE